MAFVKMNKQLKFTVKINSVVTENFGMKLETKQKNFIEANDKRKKIKTKIVNFPKMR